MTIFFASNQIDDFTQSGRVGDSVSLGSFDPAVVNNSVSTQGNGEWIQTPSIGLLSNFWFHCERTREGVNNTESPTQFLDSSGTVVLRQRFNAGSSVAQIEAWNGSAWFAVGSTFSNDLPTNNPARIDISVRIQTIPTPTTFVEFYYNGVLFQSGSVNFAINPISFVRLSGSSFNGINRYSQIIVADEPTINMRFYQRAPTAAGALQAFSGTFANIDDPTLDLNDFISTSNVNAVSTFTAPARPLTGFAIRAVVISANARRGVNGPQAMQLVIRQGGVDYFGPTTPLNLGFAKYNRIMELNPATSLPWTDSEAASAGLEFGIRSIS